MNKIAEIFGILYLRVNKQFHKVGIFKQRIPNNVMENSINKTLLTCTLNKFSQSTLAVDLDCSTQSLLLCRDITTYYISKIFSFKIEKCRYDSIL